MLNVDILPGQPDIIITRRFAAPRTLVWKTFSEPYHLSQWWGCKDFTNPVCELDFRIGGHWHNVMRGPDGTEYPTDSVFIDIVPMDLIVFRNAPAVGEVWGDNPPPGILQTLTFEDVTGGTLLTLHASFANLAERERTIRRGFVEGTAEGFDRLDAVLSALSSG